MNRSELIRVSKKHKIVIMRKNKTQIKLETKSTKKAIAITLFWLVILSDLFEPNQAALLTNLYSKKLSELTDYAHRFLVVPSSVTQQPASLSSAQSGVSSQSPLAAAWTNSGVPRQVSGNLNASPISASNIGSTRRLASYTQQEATNGNLSLEASRIASETSMAESVTTENPNVNNLGSEITKILKKFFHYGYDKRVRPNYSGPPALVNVSFHIIGISSVDEVQMDFTTDFYFRQKWYDPRLEFAPVGEVDELCVGAEFAEKIWLPDTFFANEKTATFHKATTENTFIRIAHTGRVYRSIRLTVTCSCPMDLQYFPMDRQRCKIEIESYGYNTRDIDYRWERGDQSVSLNTKIELPQFKILGFKMGQEIQNLSSGDYIRLYCEIHFVRSMGYYLIQIYIPASLIVMISWVSFWLHRNATPARVALGVTTVLTMTTLMSSTNAALPKISYIKSIDVFLGTCFVMVFASLLEYASVGYIGKRIAMKRKRLQDLQQMQQHHQKVCVAAAASAAASAAHANEINPAAAAPELAKHEQADYSSAGTMHRPSAARSGTVKLVLDSSGNSLANDQAGGYLTPKGRSATLARRRLVPAVQANQGNNNNNIGFHQQQPPHHQSQTIGRLPVGGHIIGGPLMAANSFAALASQAAAAAQPSGAEFEVSQTQDMIKICGLTPSAIDKHSRVVFPICFVCFNLMYWIIYGHISQQIEDKGPPLIPFIKG